MSESTCQHRAEAEGKSARCAVLTISDTRTKETDKGGQYNSKNNNTIIIAQKRLVDIIRTTPYHRVKTAAAQSLARLGPPFSAEAGIHDYLPGLLGKNTVSACVVMKYLCRHFDEAAALSGMIRYLAGQDNKHVESFTLLYLRSLCEDNMMGLELKLALAQLSAAAVKCSSPRVSHKKSEKTKKINEDFINNLKRLEYVRYFHLEQSRKLPDSSKLNNREKKGQPAGSSPQHLPAMEPPVHHQTDHLRKRIEIIRRERTLNR